MIHLLITVRDESVNADNVLGLLPGRGAGGDLIGIAQSDVRVLTEDQRFVTKSALRFYGRKQDKNREDLTRKGRLTVEVDQRIANIDAAYDVIGWDEPDEPLETP